VLRNRTKGRLIVPKTLGIAAAIWLVTLLLTDPADYFLIFRMLLTAVIFTLFHALQPILQVNNLVNRTASVIADASYSLYLSHWFMLSGLGKLFGVLHLPQILDFPVRLVALSLCVLFAIASFRYVELPISRVLNPRLSKDRHAALPGLPQASACAPVTVRARCDKQQMSQ
jgi:exopolysaccharide production protein ExoZ